MRLFFTPAIIVLLLISHLLIKAEHVTPETVKSLSIEDLVNLSIGDLEQIDSIFQSINNKITKDSLNIGLLAPTSYFPETVIAADLAVSYINQHNGVNGHKLALLNANTQLDSATAGNLANVLIEQFNVKAFIGPATSSSAFEVITKVTSDTQIPVISHTASSDVLTTVNSNGLFWRLVANNAQQTRLIADTLLEHGNYTGVAVVGNRDIYSKEIAQGVKDTFSEMINVAYDELFVSDLVYLEGMNLSYQIKRLQDKGINAIVVTLQLNQMNAFIRKINDNWKGPLPTIITSDVAKFSYLKNYNHGPIQHCIYTYQSMTTGLNSELLTKIRGLVNTDAADYDSAYIFDAIMLYAMAKQIQQSKDIDFKQALTFITSDGHSISYKDYPNIVSLANEHTALSYKGYTGRVKFDENGNNIAAQKAVVPLVATNENSKYCYRTLNKT
jgi:ABC-type branched-subunit amino acid transport system substrate-binding protein